MLFKETFSTLREMYTEGGLEVATIDDESLTGPTQYLARTIIQPDADVIMVVSRKALGNSEAWQTHLEAVTKKVNSIRRLRTLLRNLWSLSLIPLVWGTYGFFSGDIVQIAWSFALAVLPLAIRPIVTQLAGRYLLKRLKTRMT